MKGRKRWEGETIEGMGGEGRTEDEDPKDPKTKSYLLINRGYEGAFEEGD